MVHSTVLVNNLVPDENSVTVDPMSQLFVRVELMFGLNRVHMLDKLMPRRKIFATIYAVSEDSPWNQWVTIASMCFVVGNIMCLLLPCVHRDQLQYEVRRLRMLVALRLYENKMNKRSRVSARALLALTGAHGLGVSLLGMLRVDISLPLHYVSLLVTYLIILLQFQKVNRV
ncbi:unnamed protein product [Plutella xylostella]|uniref:(diamondback moth) hypothetical protein n=1 Tax=Plutella xylostella TaxID=51655 RepID=A0A8S4E832_PLUXY|nr:unnamed protein product [Plutella xylostella]